jgi:hypothetical protein
MGAPLASGTPAGSTSGSWARLRTEVASAAACASVDTRRSYDRTTLPDRHATAVVVGHDFAGPEAQGDRHHVCGETRPLQQQRGRRPRWLLRRGAIATCTCKPAAGQAASKHLETLAPRPGRAADGAGRPSAPSCAPLARRRSLFSAADPPSVRVRAGIRRPTSESPGGCGSSSRASTSMVVAPERKRRRWCRTACLLDRLWLGEGDDPGWQEL